MGTTIRNMALGLAIVAAGLRGAACAATVALWLFDEPASAYPSSILNDAGPGRYVLALGRGGRLVTGRFGNALEAVPAKPLSITSRLLEQLNAPPTAGSPVDPDDDLRAKAVEFGLIAATQPPGRQSEPLSWQNATFAALSTVGERHLRSSRFVNPAATKLNLGAFDWTVEFWYSNARPGRGVLLEVGSGPRGDNDLWTRVTVDATAREIGLVQGQDGLHASCAATPATFDGRWHHVALVHRQHANTLDLYVDGRRCDSKALASPIRAVPPAKDAYLTLGTDEVFEQRLPGKLDELRISDVALYDESFSTPDSFSATYSGRILDVELAAGPPLLFGRPTSAPRAFGARKHLFLDDALIESMDGVTLGVNRPLRVERVLDHFKGHLSVVDDGAGQLRLYGQGPGDSLAVLVSADGLHWSAPDLGTEFHGARNVVIDEPVGLGTMIVDSNGPAAYRWKYLSGVRQQSIFLFTSPDGFHFTRHETAALPFAAGSQSSFYYDDQRQVYAAHHRSDYAATSRGSTRRRFLLSETRDLFRPWPFRAATPELAAEVARTVPIKQGVLDPWYCDNGPLCPPGLSIELPTALASDDALDPEGTDIYVTKALKYPWAPDAYVAFPAVYFHYWNAGPEARQTLGGRERRRGSGVVETQLAVSRDGLTWRRYPRPTYVAQGGLGRDDAHEIFMAQGIVRRGNEIWQYFGGHAGNGVDYHSPWTKSEQAPVWRAVQRLDGFVAAEASYGGGTLVTRPIVFAGSRLSVNADTAATGHVQVGIQDEGGKFFDAFHVDKCVYVNGDFLASPIEWLGHGTDVSELAGKPIRLYFRMRGARLFAFELK